MHKYEKIFKNIEKYAKKHLTYANRGDILTATQNKLRKKERASQFERKLKLRK